MKQVSVIIGESLNHLLNWFLHMHWFIHEVPPCSVYDLVTPALALFGNIFASKGNYLTLTFYLFILLYKINYTFTIMLVCIARLCKEDRLFSDFSWFCWIRFTENFYTSNFSNLSMSSKCSQISRFPEHVHISNLWSYSAIGKKARNQLWET